MKLKVMTVTISVIFFWVTYKVDAIWPPAYNINLSHEETFEISEELTGEEADTNIYDIEDEMINEKQSKKFNLQKDSGKYLRLHKLVLRHNKNAETSNNDKKKMKGREVNFDKEEVEAWTSGFVDEGGKFISNEIIEKNEKRDGLSHSLNKTDYDYEALKSEYKSNINNAKLSNDTLTYTEMQDEESLKDAVNVVIGKNNKSENCTKEEMKGIGSAAVKCIWSDLSKPELSQKQRSNIFKRIAIIIQIWILVYLLVAIPCWCQRGWCCCCFQCKCCKPRERIDIAKRYLLENPAGVFQTPDNEKITYIPTNYENYAQKRLENAIMKL